MSSLCCCSPCRPAYKKKVDAIYPEIPGSGLVKSQMDALTYYAVTSPEKLDRIGEYLAEKIRHNIARNGAKYKEIVDISIEVGKILRTYLHALFVCLIWAFFLFPAPNVKHSN